MFTRYVYAINSAKKFIPKYSLNELLADYSISQLIFQYF